MSDNFDVIIIGAGAAGLTAALYASRRNLSTLVISEDIGGQTNMTPHIENYPGVDPIAGPDLMRKFYDQAKGFGSEFVFEKAEKITKEEGVFHVSTNAKTYLGKTVILAFGLSHKPLGLEEEQTYLGKGLSYCATCDGPLFKNKTIAVVGETYAAIEAADYLSTLAKQVYIIAKQGALFATNDYAKKVESKENITLLKNSIVTKLEGEKQLEKMIILENEEEKEIACDGVFVKLGFMPNTHWVHDLIDIDDKKHILIDEMGQTNIEGVFACGDVTQSVFKQIVIASGEGAKAALTAAKYLAQKQATDLVVDWTTH